MRAFIYKSFIFTAVVVVALQFGGCSGSNNSNATAPTNGVTAGANTNAGSNTSLSNSSTYPPLALAVANGDLENLDGSKFKVADRKGEVLLLNMWGVWCGPCRSIAPVIEGLAAEYANRVTVATVDIDDNPRLAAQYGVRSVPTVMLFAGGDVQRVFVGARSAQEYRAGIDELLPLSAS